MQTEQKAYNGEYFGVMMQYYNNGNTAFVGAYFLVDMFQRLIHYGLTNQPNFDKSQQDKSIIIEAGGGQQSIW